MAGARGGEVKVTKFFIFHPPLGQKEGEEEKKILWWYPQTDSLGERVKLAGFTEAIVRFTNSFDRKDSACHTVRTAKSLHFYYRPESEFFMTMIVPNPPTGAPHERVCNTVLRNAYRMFRLFNGPFSHLLALDLQLLKVRLDTFYSRYLGLIRFNNVPLLDILDGIQYLPLEADNFLRVQTLINRVSESFPTVAHTVFLHENKLLSYTVPKSDMSILYRYIVNNMLPSFLKAELKPSQTHRSSLFHGRFVIGPPDLNNPDDLGKQTSIFINSPSSSNNQPKDPNFAVVEVHPDVEEFHLYVYRVLNATLCLLVPIDVKVNFESFRSFDHIIGPSMQTLASRIGDSGGKVNVDTPHHYIYFNRETLSLRSSLLDVDCKLPPVPPESLALFCDLYEELQKSDYFGDVILKSESDVWVSAKKSGSREIYVVVSQKNSASISMTEVSEEVKKLCHSHFPNIFLLE